MDVWVFDWVVVFHAFPERFQRQSDSTHRRPRNSLNVDLSRGLLLGLLLGLSPSVCLRSACTCM